MLGRTKQIGLGPTCDVRRDQLARPGAGGRAESGAKQTSPHNGRLGALPPNGLRGSHCGAAAFEGWVYPARPVTQGRMGRLCQAAVEAVLAYTPRRHGRNEVNSYISVDKYRSNAHINHKITLARLSASSVSLCLLSLF